MRLRRGMTLFLTNEISSLSFSTDDHLKDHAHNTPNSAISLVVNNVIPSSSDWSTRTPITLIMYHVGEGSRPCPFLVTGNGHGRVTEPKGDQYSGLNLGMIS